MIIETAIVQLLLADATVSGLVSDRIYPQDAPQDAQRPYVVYETADSIRLPTITGYLNLRSTAFRFSSFGGDAGGRYVSAKAIDEAICDKLLPFRGETTYQSETLNVQLVEDEGGEDGLEVPAHADEEGLDYCGRNLRVHWNE